MAMLVPFVVRCLRCAYPRVTCEIILKNFETQGPYCASCGPIVLTEITRAEAHAGDDAESQENQMRSVEGRR